jgi:putative transposase
MRYRRIREPGATYFFTVVTFERSPILADESSASLLQTCITEVRRFHPFEIDAYVILPDHIHMLWTLPAGDTAYPRRWRLIKSMFTHRYLRTNSAPELNASRRVKAEQAVWQRRFWEHLVRDDDDYAAHIDYIHLNPVRHGLASRPLDWPNSSFPTWVAKGFYAENWAPDALPALPLWLRDQD